jgi:iduronate 2-sulfatase
MHLKRALVGLGATLIFAGLMGTVSPHRTAAVGLQQAAGNPNVLFIMSDDLNDDMGAFGHPIVQTPNIDRLAAQGVRFDRAFTQYALCNPSRASLMTGLRPDTTKVYDLTTHFRAAVPDVVTLPQMFQQAGYFAARVGKIYHYGNPGDIGTSGLDDPPSWNKFVNPKGIDIDEQPKLSFAGPSRALGSSLSYYASPAKDEEHTDGMVATETIKLIEQNRTRRFFIAAGFYRPHCPYIAPKKYFDLYLLDRIPVSEYSELLLSQSPTAAHGISWNVPEQEQREAVRAYYASISFMDAQLGRILDALDSLNLRQNTIIVFMSDHGYHLGDHGGLWMKQTVFERATRTPMMMAGPGVTAKGQVSHRIVELLDIYPTLAALARVAAPAGLQGRSFQSLLVNPKAEWDHAVLSQVRRAISIGTGARGRGAARGAGAGDPTANRAQTGRGVGRGAAASSLTGPDADGAVAYQATAAPGPDTGYTIRTELYRYISWNDGKAGEELFDELNDPGETRNLVAQPFYANVLADMRQRLVLMKNAAAR